MFNFEKEKEGAIEVEWKDTGHSYELKGWILDSTGELLDGKYYATDRKIIYYYKNGKLQRDSNLPAIIWDDGSLFYYVNDKFHRIDGPAKINSIGYYWYINGHYIENEVMNDWLKENDIPLDWNTWTDNDKNRFSTYWIKKYGSPVSIKEETITNNNFKVSTKTGIYFIKSVDKNEVEEFLSLIKEDDISIEEIKTVSFEDFKKEILIKKKKELKKQLEEIENLF